MYGWTTSVIFSIKDIMLPLVDPYFWLTNVIMHDSVQMASFAAYLKDTKIGIDYLTKLVFCTWVTVT